VAYPIPGRSVSVQRATITSFGAALSLRAAPTAVPTVGAGVVLRTSLLDCRALLAWAAGFIFGFHARWPQNAANYGHGMGITSATEVGGKISLFEGSLEVKLPTIWTDEKQSRAEAQRRERLEERRVAEKESEERRCRCAKR